MNGLVDTLKQLFGALRGAPFVPTTSQVRKPLPRSEVEKLRPQVMEIVDKYLPLKSLTEPCDRAAAEKAVADVYAVNGLPAPTFLWFASPLPATQAAILWNIMHATTKLAPLQSDNKLVFDATSIAVQVDATERDDLLPMMQNAAMPTDQRVARDRRLNLLLAFELWHLPDRHNNVISRHCEWTLSGRDSSQPYPLDTWLGTWQALLEALRQKGGAGEALVEQLERFGEIFWAMTDEEQRTLLNRSRLREFNLHLVFRPTFMERAFHRFAGGNSDLMIAFLMEAMHLFGDRPTDAFYAFRETFFKCGWWRPYRDVCLMVERPEEIHLDQFSALHQIDGPAIRYRDGFEVYALQNIEVTREIAFCEFTPRDIEWQRNTEVRRVMIERYGAGRYFKETGAAEIHRDEFGVLYAKDVPGDEPIYMVKVKNSSPEPDGTFKEYYLRVPPTMRTARAAVAWTFDFAESDYTPTVET